MSKPQYLFIDEMSLGVAPLIVDRMIVAIRDIQAGAKMGLLVVEQVVMLALELAGRAYVLETGCIVSHGDSKDLASDPRSAIAYLGM